jgi:predicted membrane protein
MGHIFSGFFWGAFLVLLGTAIILKAVYHIEVPVFRIFLGLLVVAFGLRLLFGGFGHHRHKDTIAFEEGVMEASENQKEYNIIFGRGTVDLRDLVVGEKSMRVEINTLFGAATVRLNPNVPARIRANTAFGGIRLPDANNAAFGTYVYSTKDFNESSPHLVINVNVVFGGMEIVE